MPIRVYHLAPGALEPGGEFGVVDAVEFFAGYRILMWVFQSLLLSIMLPSHHIIFPFYALNVLASTLLALVTALVLSIFLKRIKV